MLQDTHNLHAAAFRLGVSISVLAAEASAQYLHVPLGEQGVRRVGAARITAIKEGLRAGIPKLTLMQRFKVSEWTLIRIELDDPDCSRQWDLAQSSYLRDMHRGHLEALLRRRPAATRTDVMRLLPGTYDYIISHDKEWFQARIARLIPKRRPHRPLRNSVQRDKKLAQACRGLVRDELQSGCKPVRITKCRMLKSYGWLSRYMRSPASFPLTTKVLKEGSETVLQFRKRKLTWAIGSLHEAGQPISVNVLRRRAGLPASKVRSHSRFIASAVRSSGAEIASKSFFS